MTDFETKEKCTTFRVTEELHDSGYVMLDQLEAGPIINAKDRHSHDVIQIYIDGDYNRTITIDVEQLKGEFYLRIHTAKPHEVDYFSETCRIKLANVVKNEEVK